MYTFAQLLFDDTAALVARLRRVFWVNRDDLDPGPDGLVVEQITEYPDAYVVGLPFLSMKLRSRSSSAITL